MISSFISQHLRDVCDLFKAYGTDQLYLTDFNSDFARTSSDDFIARYIDRLKAQEVVVGFDYKFGHHRTDADYLARNFSGNVHVIEEQQSDGEKISSTRVRQLIREGKVKEANKTTWSRILDTWHRGTW